MPAQSTVLKILIAQPGFPTHKKISAMIIKYVCIDQGCGSHNWLDSAWAEAKTSTV